MTQRTAILNEVIDTTPQGVVVLDENYIIRLASKKVATISGLSPKMWRSGSDVRALLELGIANGAYEFGSLREFESAMKAALGEKGVFETLRRQKDGRIICESIHERPIGGYIVTYTDVTAQKQREQNLVDMSAALERSRDAAEAASQAKSSFLANMSHEIRTPMNGVIGMASLLADTELSEKQKEMARTIVSSGEGLLTIINDILDFSRLEAGKVALRPAPFDLRGAVEDVCALLNVRADEKAIDLIVSIDPDLPGAFMGDEGRIRQIIVNLIGNAVKFTQTGHVAVEVKRDDAPEAPVLIIVEDTGCGVPEEKQATIFEEFEQVDTTSQRRFDGAGLGLAISSRLVRQMDGAITLKSDGRSGSRFVVELPLPVEAPRPDERNKAPLGDGRRALICGGHALRIKTLARQLAHWGFKVATASHEDEAFKHMVEAAANGAHFDIVLVDEALAPHGGGAFEERLSAVPSLAPARCILLRQASSYRDGDATARGEFDHHLIKPVKAEALRRALVRALDEDGSADPTVACETEPPVGDDKENAPTAASTRVLVAEDNPVNQMVARTLLEKLGADVAIADNGRRALNQLSKERVDLIFMDLSMPEMDGLEATRRIRALEASDGSFTPIIGLSAHAMNEDRDRCLAAGMDDYLTKPVQLEALRRMVEKWSGSGRLKTLGETVAR